jgi:hypothetical protein
LGLIRTQLKVKEMTYSSWTFVICSVVGSLVGAASVSYGGELTEARFKELQQQLQPSPDELWRTVPWKTALLDAQRTAAAEKKPIFIWAMDGHPLGCT